MKKIIKQLQRLSALRSFSVVGLALVLMLGCWINQLEAAFGTRVVEEGAEQLATKAGAKLGAEAGELAAKEAADEAALQAIKEAHPNMSEAELQAELRLRKAAQEIARKPGLAPKPGGLKPTTLHPTNMPAAAEHVTVHPTNVPAEVKVIQPEAGVPKAGAVHPEPVKVEPVGEHPATPAKVEPAVTEHPATPKTGKPSLTDKTTGEKVGEKTAQALQGANKAIGTVGGDAATTAEQEARRIADAKAAAQAKLEEATAGQKKLTATATEADKKAAQKAIDEAHASVDKATAEENLLKQKTASQKSLTGRVKAQAAKVKQAAEDKLQKFNEGRAASKVKNAEAADKAATEKLAALQKAQPKDNAAIARAAEEAKAANRALREAKKSEFLVKEAPARKAYRARMASEAAAANEQTVAQEVVASNRKLAKAEADLKEAEDARFGANEKYKTRAEKNAAVNKAKSAQIWAKKGVEDATELGRVTKVFEDSEVAFKTAKADLQATERELARVKKLENPNQDSIRALESKVATQKANITKLTEDGKSAWWAKKKAYYKAHPFETAVKVGAGVAVGVGVGYGIFGGGGSSNKTQAAVVGTGAAITAGAAGGNVFDNSGAAVSGGTVTGAATDAGTDTGAVDTGTDTGAATDAAAQAADQEAEQIGDQSLEGLV